MSDKWLVLKASGGGGLGDSIKSLLVAAYYADLTNRVLVVDWRGSVYAEEGVDVFSYLFKLKNLKTQQPLPSSKDIYPDAWRGRLDKSLHEVYTQDGWDSWQRSKVIETYSFDLSKTDYDQAVLVMWEFDQVNALCQNQADLANPTDLYQAACKKYLHFSDMFKAKLSPILATFTEPMLGVHIRATDEFNSNKGTLLPDTYLNAVNNQLKSKPDLGIFLATDNVSVQAWFKQHFPNVIITDKWFAEAGQPLHMNEQCPDVLLNVSDALLDIVLLSH